jgi:SAM-dependent methyltransferase
MSDQGLSTQQTNPGRSDLIEQIELFLSPYDYLLI